MNKILTDSGEILELTSLYPAMVTNDDESIHTCRTVYEDQNGMLWCFWYGRYVRIKRIDGSMLRTGKRTKGAYVVIDQGDTDG